MKKLIIVFILSSFTVLSQSHKTYIVAACKNYASLTNYSLTLQYKLFLDNNLGKPYQTRNVEIKRMDKNVRMTQSSGLEIIDNENYQVVVNTKDKIFTARKKMKEEDLYSERSEFPSFIDNNIDTLLLIYDKIKTLEETKERVKYELIYKKNTSVEKSVVVINKLASTYESIMVFYKSPVKVNQLDGKLHTVTLKIDYAGFKKNCIYDKELFNEKRYITVNTKNVIAPVKKYSAYKLIISNEE